jgi:hypothetical protein
MSNARMQQVITDKLDDLFDKLDYEFGQGWKPSEIHKELEDNLTGLGEAYKDWFEQGDTEWS